MNRHVVRRAPGFTLVELLVALAIFGALSAAGVAVLAYAADNRGVAAARMERLAEFQRARALLQADFAQVALRRVREAGGAPARNAFTGATGDASVDAPLFGFVRRGWRNPDALPRASLQYVEYRLADGRLERSARPALDGAAPAEPVVLLRGVQAARVRYWSANQWSDGWPGGARVLPRAVALTLELDGLGEIEQWFLLPEAAP